MRDSERFLLLGQAQERARLAIPAARHDLERAAWMLEDAGITVHAEHFQTVQNLFESAAAALDAGIREANSELARLFADALPIHETKGE